MFSSSLPLQVSAEPDGSSYVFQGFIQGKDYGQFGLQRLGNFLLGLITASQKSIWTMNDNWKKSDELFERTSLMEEAIRELLFAVNGDLFAHAESALQWTHSHPEQKLCFRYEVILQGLNSINLHPTMTSISIK